jgi:hypothetical protein
MQQCWVWAILAEIRTDALFTPYRIRSMADTATKRSKLNEQQKTEVRALMADYRQSHPGAELKELDVPYRDQLTVGVLRGLAPRKANGSSALQERELGSREGRRG